MSKVKIEGVRFNQDVKSKTVFLQFKYADEEWSGPTIFENLDLSALNGMEINASGSDKAAINIQ